jgi:hypothetical protein
MIRLRHAAALTPLLLLAGMAGCQREPTAPAATTPAPATPAATPKMAPLKASQVKVTLEPQGVGAMNPATGKFEIPVRIANDGTVALSDKTDPPVRVGVQILPSDDGTQPGVQDFTRSPLPEIAPGTAQVVNVVVPVDRRVDGRRLKLELVQEHVAWFGRLGQPGVVVGPYRVCDKALCPAAATP